MRGNKTLRKLSILVLAAAMLLNSTYLSAFAVDTAKESGDSNPAAAEEKASNDVAEVQVEEVTAPANDESGTPADTKSDAESEDPAQDVQADDPQTEENGDDQAAGSVTEPAAAEDEQTADDPAVEEPSESTENEVETFPVKITLVDADGNPVKGATLTLEDADGKIIKDKDDKEIGKWVTSDKEDEKDYELQLESGDYVLKTDKVPSGYKVLEDEIKIKVDGDGKVEIEKAKDEDGKEIESALAYKKDADGKDIENELLLTIEKEKTKSLLKAPRKAPENSSANPRFDITWINADSSNTLTLSDNQHMATDKPTADTTNASDHHLEAQVTFSIGHTESPVPAGGVQIKVPARIYTDYDGNAHGDFIIGVTEKPIENDKLFWYYLEDKNGNKVTIQKKTNSRGETYNAYMSNGTELTGLDDVFIVIENSQAINNPSGSRTDFTCMINYGYRPTAVDEDKDIKLDAQYSVTGFTESQLQIDNKTLKADIDTSATLSDVRKQGYRGSGNSVKQYSAWDDSWGEFSDTGLSGNPTDYVYVLYDIRATVRDATQQYTLTLNEKPGNGGKMVAYTKSAYDYSGMKGYGWSYNTTSSNYAGTNLRVATSAEPVPKLHVSHHGTTTVYDPRYYSTAVLVAYKASDVPIGTEVTNAVDVTMTPDSKDAPQTLSADTKYTIRDVNFIYRGDMFNTYKYVDDKTSYLQKSTTIENAKFFLENDAEAALYNWVLLPVARGYGLAWKFKELDTSTNTYVLDLDANGNPQKIGNYSIDAFEGEMYLNGYLLEPGDYTYVRASCSPNPYDFDPIANDKVSRTTQDYELADFYYRTAQGGDWLLIQEEVPRGTYVSIPSDALELKWHIEGDAYCYEPRITVEMRLNPTDHVKQLLEQGGDTAQLINVTGLAAYDSKGNLVNGQADSTIGGDAGITQQIKDHDQNGNYPGLESNEYLQHSSATQFLGDVDLDTTFSKNESTSSSDKVDSNAEMLSSRVYELTSHQPMIFSTADTNKDALLQKLEEMGIEYGQKEVYFYDLLPESAELDRNYTTAEYTELSQSSLTSSGYSDSSTKVTGNVEVVSETRNWRDSNRTLVVFKVTFPEGERSDWGIRYDDQNQLLGLGTEVKLKLKLIYEWENLAFYGKHVVNYAAAQIPGSLAGSPDDLSVESSGASAIPESLEDAFKNIGEASGYESSGNDTYYDKQETDFNIATSSRSGYSKTVKSDIEATYRSNSAAVSDGTYTYRLRYQVEKNSEAKNIVIYDVLEEAWNESENADKYGETNRYWQGTFKSATASQPELLGAKPVIYYSTTDRKTMQEHLNTTNPDDPYANLANSSYWSTTEPADKSSITAVAFDLRKDKNGNDFVLKGGNDATSVLYLYIDMDAPTRDEVLDYNGDGPLMDPTVYAFNNSFLTISSRSGAGEWSTASRAISDGTTVRIAEPNPPIYKAEDDDDEHAGKSLSDQDNDTDSATLDARNEVIKYTVESRVPLFGNDSSGQPEVNKWTIVDELEPVLEMVKKDAVKITIGKADGDKYFSYDAKTNQYELKIKTDDIDTDSGQNIWIEESGTGLPKGFILVRDNTKDYNTGYSHYSTSTSATNALKFTLGYSGMSSSSETTADTPSNPLTFNRVAEFAGEEVHIEFYAKIREGVSLGKYEDQGTILIPNTAKYVIPNKNDTTSNTVKITPPDEPKTPPKKKINGVDAVFYLVDSATGSPVTVTDEDGNEKAVKLTLNTETGNYEDADGNVVTPAAGQEIKTQYEMENETETISYTISGKIPQNADTYTLSDSLENVLEFVDTSDITIKISGTSKVYELDDAGKIKLDDEGVPVTTDKTYERKLSYKEAQALSSTSYNLGEGFGFSVEGQLLKLELGSAFINKTGDAIVSSQNISFDEETDEDGNTTIKNPSISSDENLSVSYSKTPSADNKYEFGLSGANIEITFKAKIKDGADLSPYATEIGTEIPNVATHRINTNPSEDSDPVVIVPPTPPIFKRVNNKSHENLDSRNQVFNYLINVKIPDADEDDEEVTSLVIYDELEDVLEFQNVGADGTDTFTAKIVGEDGTAVYTLTADEIAAGRSFPDGADGQKIEFSLPQELIQQYSNHRLAINFDARIRADKTVDDLAKYRENNVTRIPNESNYKINDKFDYKSNKVTVTPPDIGKTVNNVSNYTVQGLNEVFEYEVTAIIPVAGEDEEITSFVLTDDLNDVVEFANEDETIAAIAGENLKDEELAAQVKRDGQNITFSLTKDQIKDHGGKVATLSFKARIKEGADITPYIEGTGIPNVVRYVINDDPTRSRASRPVYVNPPEIGKLVNEKQHEDLGTKDEIFTYKITALIPKTAQTAPDEDGGTTEAEVTSFYIKDEIKDVLEFAEEDATTVKVGDTDLSATEISSQVSRNGQLIRLDLTEDQVAENRGKYVIFEFKAKIKDDADLSEYITDDGSVKVPNTSTKGYNVPNGPENGYEVDSNEVTVTPPRVEKKVNDNYDVVLGEYGEVFTYTVETYLPAVADKFEISDTVEAPVEIVEHDSATVTVDGKKSAIKPVISGDNKTITVTFEANDLTEETAKKRVILTFKAKLQDGADLTPYLQGMPKVPNRAKITLNDNPSTSYESNPVTVTPPPVEKEVNNKKHEDLKTRDEVFEYEVRAFVPEYLEVDNEGNKVLPTKFVLSDTLVDELEYVDDGKAKVLVGSTKGKEAEKADLLSNIKVEGQTVVFELKDNQIKDYLGQYILVTFDAKIKDGANLAKYADANGDVKVPNKATLKLDDDPKWTLESNTVTITPPDPKEPPIEKLVNDKQHEDLKTRTEVFEYKIKTAIPADAVSFVITDTLVDELEFTESDATSVVIGSEKLAADEVSKQIKIDGQKLTLELTKEQLQTSERAVVLTFKAKVRDGVDLGKYKVNGKPQVPNIAGYEFENASGEKVKKDSDEVTVTPPDPENPPLEKKTNDKYYVEDGAERKSITYTITSRIPLDADKFEIVDELEDVLEFTNVSGTKVLIDGEELSTYQRDALIKRSGQKISLTFTKKLIQANPEKEITLVFEAMTKKGADLSPYNVDGHIIIPNTAGYIINDDPKTARNSNTVTVKIPEPPIRITTENKPTSKDTPGTGVKTGDTTRIIVWIVLLVLAALVAGAVVVRRRLSKK